MTSIVPVVTVNANDLPEDIFSYNHDQFYEFIKDKYGPDLAALFSFQAIRSPAHLLCTSCDDILMILQQKSDDITHLKQLCCFKVADNKYEIKLGVKLAINSFIQLLKLKQEQQKKKKRSSTQRSSTIPTQPQNATPLSPSTLSSPSTIDTVSAQSTLTLTKKKLNEAEHKADIEERISKWWSTNNNDDDLALDEGKNYFLAINKSINDTFACILTCQCDHRFKLPFIIPGFFKLSSFYRHVKEKQCIKHSKVVSVSHHKISL
jgi:hypothetical protein